MVGWSAALRGKAPGWAGDGPAAGGGVSNSLARLRGAAAGAPSKSSDARLRGAATGGAASADAGVIQPLMVLIKSRVSLGALASPRRSTPPWPQFHPARVLSRSPPYFL